MSSNGMQMNMPMAIMMSKKSKNKSKSLKLMMSSMNSVRMSLNREKPRCK